MNVQIPGVPLPLTLLNLHLEAFSQDNRELHLIKLKDRLLDYSVDIAGGDFNGNLALSESLFTQEWKCITPAEPTFSSQHPTEILDGFIVKNSRIQVLKHEVMNTGLTSDHFAVLMEIEIKN
mgnify:CR=1 FL=1